MFIYCTVIPSSHINSLWQWVQFSVIIIKSNDTGWVLFTRKVWRTLSVKKSCYDKNSIFIILNLHHDAPFNLSSAAQCSPEMQHFYPDTCTGCSESLSPGLPHTKTSATCQMIPATLKAIFWDIYFTRTPHRLIICHPGGDDNFSGQCLGASGAGSGSCHAVPDEERMI